MSGGTKKGENDIHQGGKDDGKKEKKGNLLEERRSGDGGKFGEHQHMGVCVNKKIF